MIFFSGAKGVRCWRVIDVGAIGCEKREGVGSREISRPRS